MDTGINGKTLRKRKCIFISLICITVVKLVVLLVLAGYWRVLRENLLKNEQQELCYKWDRFISAEDEERCLDGFRLEFNKDKNTTFCCGSAGLVLDKLVSKDVSDKYNSNSNPETTSLDLTEFNCKASKMNQPVANLVGLAKSKQPVLVGKSSKVFWNPHKPSYANSGMKYLADDGTLYVNKSGLYYIFSQMKINFGNLSSTYGYAQQTFRHFIHLISYSKGTATVLLEDAKSQCDAVSNSSEVTSVLGALFKLADGDRLYVATSHPQHLSYGDSNSFFSIHSV